MRLPTPARRTVEKGLKLLGLKPRKLRSGETWSLEHAGLEVVLGGFVMTAGQGVGLQMLVKIAKAKPEHPMFFERMLQLNAEARGLAVLGRDGDGIWLMRARALEGLDAREVAESLRWLMHLPRSQQDALAETFGADVRMDAKVAQVETVLSSRTVPGDLRRTARHEVQRAIRLAGHPDVTHRVTDDSWRFRIGDVEIRATLAKHPLMVRFELETDVLEIPYEHPGLFETLATINDEMGGLAAFGIADGWIRLYLARDAQGLDAHEALRMVHWLALYHGAYLDRFAPYLEPMVRVKGSDARADEKRDEAQDAT